MSYKLKPTTVPVFRSIVIERGKDTEIFNKNYSHETSTQHNVDVTDWRASPPVDPGNFFDTFVNGLDPIVKTIEYS